MSLLDPHIFRAYDIRGKAFEQITEEGCKLIGKAFGSALRERYSKESPTVAVGRDARTHSLQFQRATMEDLQSAGCHVLDIGMTPSPVNYFTMCSEGLDGGVQITASHNPPQDNGLKLQVRDAEAFAGEELQRLRRRIETEDFVSGTGAIESFDAAAPYLNHLEKLFKGAGEGMAVVIDGGNGVAGPTYSEALKRSGADVTELFIEPDGTFPNHLADPSKRETLKDLQAEVQAQNAAVGFAFDGDGDRLGVVDEKGSVRTADEVLLLLAKDHLQRNPGGSVLFTVSNSGALQSEIEKWGGHPVMCKVGHSHVEQAMRHHSALLGGEQSGHFFCGEDYYGFDDALVAALRILKILHETGQPLSGLCRAFPKVYQAPELRPHCPDDSKADVVGRIAKHFQKKYPVNTLDGARIDFGDGAWASIRMSNTSPKLSLCMEARSPEKLKEIEEIVLSHLKEYPDVGIRDS